MFDTGVVRTEVWHAMSVHFPIALLIFSTLTMLASFIVDSARRNYWRYAASGLLFAGTVFAWTSLYTGNLADGLVARRICDPTILKEHELAAQTMSYLFTAASLLNAFLLFKSLKPVLHSISYYIVFFLMLTGSVYLIYAGHLGASLVYQQGAGVYKHTYDCDE